MKCKAGLGHNEQNSKTIEKHSELLGGIFEQYVRPKIQVVFSFFHYFLKCGMHFVFDGFCSRREHTHSAKLFESDRTFRIPAKCKARSPHDRAFFLQTSTIGIINSIVFAESP